VCRAKHLLEINLRCGDRRAQAKDEPRETRDTDGSGQGGTVELNLVESR
jgi:hypothetical protein